MARPDLSKSPPTITARYSKDIERWVTNLNGEKVIVLLSKDGGEPDPVPAPAPAPAVSSEDPVKVETPASQSAPAIKPKRQNAGSLKKDVPAPMAPASEDVEETVTEEVEAAAADDANEVVSNET